MFTRYRFVLQRVLCAIGLFVCLLLLGASLGLSLSSISSGFFPPVQAQSAGNPFLYLPFRVVDGQPNYMNVMTSVFDHSSPNYTRSDKRIVMFNGGLFDDNCASYDYQGNVVANCAGSLQSFNDTTLEFPRVFYNGHNGYDWAIAGSVLAAAGGTIQWVGWASGDKACLGYMVVIDHQNGYRTTYGHLADQSSTYNIGDPVTVGYKIGDVGNTTGCGTSTGTHLHFMVEHWQASDQSWHVTDPFGWVGGDVDPLTNYNGGEASQNLWVGGAPSPVGGPVGDFPSVPLNGRFMGGAVMKDDAPPPPPNPTPTPPPTTEPPPSSDGIQIVSISSHVVSPGAQINPSVTIRVTSGQLLVSRGDHLHATPEDTTNTFGAWPVQAVKSNVSTGGTYTFDVNNDSGFRMTAPNTPGSYVSRWQLRVGGNHVGPVVEIPITVQTATPPPTPSGWRAQYWNGYFSDNPWGNGRCKSDDYTDSIPFTKNWGSSGPGSGCSGDRFSVLYERRFSFSGGRYRFHCHRDGYCRFFIPELGISHSEEGGSFGGMDWGVDIPSGSWEVKIEYSHKRENGDSRLEFWWQGPESYLPPLDANCATSPYEWCAGYRVAWNSPTDSYILRRLEGSGYLDHDWGNSGPGYGIYADFSAEWSRLARFDAGLYRFHTTHDDGVKINVAGQEILNQWGTCCREDTADTWLPSGDHRITVNWFDSGGGANIKVWWEKITPCYTLNLTTTPSGAGLVGANPTPNCPADGSKYTAGTNVTLTANPSAPNDFVGWGGDVNGSANSINVAMNADKQVTAGFVRCYSLQLGSDPNGIITTNPAPNCSNSTHYRAGSNVSLYASPNLGYLMDSWQGDLSGSSNPTVIVLDQNKSVSATFVTSSLPPPDAWRGEYFNTLTLSGSPSLVRYDAAINFSWQGDSPDPGIDPDFSARWTRQIDFAPGNYRFSLTHDDGIRLWIDDVLQLDQWGTCCRTDEIEVNLTEGPHLLRVEFVDTGGWAEAIVDWALITPFSTTIDAIDPTPPYCVVRSAPTAYARTLTIAGENISTVDYHHLQFRNMDTGEVSIHFHQEIAWRSPTRAVVDFDRIKAMLWSDSKIRLSVRVTGPTYGPLSGWSPEFLLADYETACGSARPAAPLPEAPLVSATVDGNNLVLSWPDALANETYRVLRHTAPYFDPEASGSLLIGSANSNGTTANCSIGPQSVVCTDVGALTDPQPVTFYLVQALNAEGVPVSTSRVGRFSFSILSGE